MLNVGFCLAGGCIDFVTETELFAAGPTTRRRKKKQEQVSDVEALDQRPERSSLATRWCTPPMALAATGFD
jgi:hypothetical protein